MVEERDLLFKCMNCKHTFIINIGDFKTLACPRCQNKPSEESCKNFKSAISSIYSVEAAKEQFGFDFQYPSISIY
jgi:Zn finger protein HypA/HybF involved in hydrogenase expression